MGMRVGEITPEIQRQLQLDSANGVVIMEVEPQGPADRVRLQPGDVIVGVDKREVVDLGDFNEALAAAGDRAVIRLRVLRSGVERFYFVERKTEE
jgi:serine protease Do